MQGILNKNDKLYGIKQVLIDNFIQCVPDMTGTIKTDNKYMQLDDLAVELRDAANRQMIADNRNKIQPLLTLVEFLIGVQKDESAAEVDDMWMIGLLQQCHDSIKSICEIKKEEGLQNQDSKIKEPSMKMSEEEYYKTKYLIACTEQIPIKLRKFITNDEISEIFLKHAHANYRIKDACSCADKELILFYFENHNVSLEINTAPLI